MSVLQSLGKCIAVQKIYSGGYHFLLETPLQYREMEGRHNGIKEFLFSIYQDTEQGPQNMTKVDNRITDNRLET